MRASAYAAMSRRRAWYPSEADHCLLYTSVGDGSFKLRKSFDIADTLACHIILLGEDEVSTNTATVKTFATGVQKKVERSALLEVLRKQDGSF